ncbi:MAG: hypothetical protein JXR68_10015 [Bacteroidales bacterium]|nr:hypothetical protein [Bacteroidales bacterium]
MKFKHFLLVVFTVIFNLPFSQLNAQNIRADGGVYPGNIYHMGGNIGIGTTQPNAQIDIYGSDSASIRLSKIYSNILCTEVDSYYSWEITNNNNLTFSIFDNQCETITSYNSFMTLFSTGQLLLGDGTINSSAILHLKSKDKGLLIPRMTNAEINNIPNPAQGLLVFSTDDNNFKYFYGQIETWQTIPNLSEINTLLSNYVTTTDLTTTLNDYSTTIEINTLLSDYVTITDLTTTLNDYSTTTEINTLLSNYVTITDLTTTLNDYSTTTEINTLLSDYVTITDLTTTLNDYSTTADIVATYLSIDDFNTIIADYAQTSDLDNYLTTSEIEANYVSNHSNYTNSIFTTNNNGDLVYLQAGNQGEVLTVNNDGYFSWAELSSASESLWNMSGYNIFTKSLKNNIGIGFSDHNINDFYPQTKLHIFNLIENDAQQTATSSLRIEEYDRNIGFFKAWDIQNNNGSLFFAYSNSQNFEKKNPSKKVVFSKNGFVGINTTAPEYFLDINGDARIMQDLTLGGKNGGIGQFTNFGNLVFDTDNNQLNISSTGSFVFFNNENEVASITADGNFSANNANFSGHIIVDDYLSVVTNPNDAILNLNSDAGTANGIFVKAGYSGAGTTLLKLESADNKTAMIVKGNGNVG